MRRLLRKLCAVLWLAGFGAAAVSGTAPEVVDMRPVVRVGLVDTFSPDFYIHTYAATIQYLKHRLPEYRFESVEYSTADQVSPEDVRNLDFLVSSAGTFGIHAQKLGAEHIVIRLRGDAKQASRSVAAVFVTRSDNERIRTLADMRGSRLAATSSSSFDGWLIAQDEIARAGFSPESFFASVQFTEYNYPDVISRVLVGQADVGVLTRCELENFVQQGLVDARAVRVINAKEQTAEPCRRSTSLYPAEVVAVFPHTDVRLAKAVTIALLQMPVNKEEGVGWEWVTVNDLVNISGLMERLSLGPYAYQREFTLPALARRFWREIVLLLALAAAVIFHILRVDRLVMQRTRELMQTVREKEALLERMKRTQQYLQLLERNTIVSQLSSLFAHEMKQPITNVVNYAAGLQMLRASGRDNDPAIDTAIKAIGDQTRRMAQIVDRVRAYAKHKTTTKTDCVLSDIVEAMLENFRLAHSGVCEIRVNVPTNIRVNADPVALELLLLNLVRNAERAARSVPHPEVRIVAHQVEHQVRIEVSDNGLAVEDSLFERLAGPGGVESSQGLGMGLAIAKGIAENHNGHLEFARSDGGGLAVTLVMVNESTSKENAYAQEPTI